LGGKTLKIAGFLSFLGEKNHFLRVFEAENWRFRGVIGLKNAYFE